MRSSFALDVSPKVFDDPAIRRAKRSIRARRAFRPRTKRWIQRSLLIEIMHVCFLCVVRPLLESLVRLVMDSGVDVRYALLFNLAYAFLLRVPSEAIPAVAGEVGTVVQAHAVITCDECSMTLTLQSRKNKPLGSTLIRKCTCKVGLCSSSFVCDVRLLAGIRIHVCCTHSR